MASIEYSLAQNINYTASSGSATVYIQLGSAAVPVGTITVLKYLAIRSSVAIGGGAPGYNYILSSSDTNPAGTLIPMRCTPVSAVSANTLIEIIPKGKDFIVDNPYLAIELNSATSGTLSVFYSILQIPSGNLLQANFAKYAGLGASGNNIIVTQNAPYVPVVRTANIMNLTGSSVTAYYTYSTIGITTPTAIPSFTDSVYDNPTYISATAGTYNFGYNGASPINYYVSTSTNLQA